MDHHDFPFEADDFWRCMDFAEAVWRTTPYDDTGQSMSKWDHWYGKLGEVVAHRYLLQCGFQCAGPDFTIHDPKDKTFHPDLVGFQNSYPYRFHVKSQTTSSATAYGGLSATVQRDSTRGRKDREFLKGQQGDYLILVEITNEQCIRLPAPERIVPQTTIELGEVPALGRIWAVAHLPDIISNGLLDDPFLEKYRGLKYSVYYQRLVDAGVAQI